MYLAIRELRHFKLRSLLLGGIVALIAFMVFMLLGLTRGLSRDSASLLLDTPAVAFATTQESGAVFARSFVTPEQVAEAQALSPGATPLAQNMVSFSRGDEQFGGVLLGIDPRGFLAPAGPALGGNGVIADESLRREGVQVGDTLALQPGGERLQVLGFTGNSRLSHQPALFVDLDTWQRLRGRGESVSAVALQETLPPDAVVGLTVHERAGALQAVPGYKEEQGSLTMIQVFLVAVTAFVLAAFFYVMTLQKTAQFGLLKAIGASNRALGVSLVSQMLLLTVAALLTAAVATVVVAQVLPAGLPFFLRPLDVLLGSVGLLAVALLASLLSLRSIARIDPLIAIGTQG